MFKAKYLKEHKRFFFLLARSTLFKRSLLISTIFSVFQISTYSQSHIMWPMNHIFFSASGAKPRPVLLWASRSSLISSQLIIHLNEFVYASHIFFSARNIPLTHTTLNGENSNVPQTWYQSLSHTRASDLIYEFFLAFVQHEKPVCVPHQTCLYGHTGGCTLTCACAHVCITNISKQNHQ